jgi:hypothetical protein
MPDLNTSFGIGGKGDKTAIESLNETLQDTDATITVSQDPYGILHFQGGGDDIRQETALMPVSTGIQQVSSDTSAGLQMTTGGFVQVTNFEGEQFTMVPATKDVEDLSSVADSDCVLMGEQGETLMHTNSSSGETGEVRRVVIFDDAVSQPPPAICEPTATGEFTCDFEKAESFQKPGIHDVKNIGPQKKGTVVYSDGTSQVIYPTVYSPQTFIEEGLKQAGMEEVIFQSRGTFKVTQDGVQYIVYHNDNPTVRTVTGDESVTPSLIQTGTQLTYTIEATCSSATTTEDNGTTRQKRSETSAGEAREVMVFDSYMEPVTDSCEEIDGETVCESEESTEESSTGSAGESTEEKPAENPEATTDSGKGM